MFNTISWQAYWISLAISSGLYYLFVFLIYFRKDFKGSLLTKTFTRSGEQSFVLNEEFETPLKESDEGMVYACMDEVQAFFEEAKKRKWEKSEMIYSLQSIIKKYPAIKTSGYKQSVSKVLSNQCEHICNLHFNAEELDHVWLG